MKSTLVIARRELLERRFVFLAAIAFAALSLIIPFVPAIHAGSRREAVAILSTIFAENFAIVLAAILGATIVGRDLSERRLSFYFSRPVPAASIWFGKLIAALILIVLTAAIIATPALLAGMDAILRIWKLPNQTSTLVAIGICMPFAVFLLAHAIGTFVRSCSVWIILDFVAAAICGVVLWFFAQKLSEGFAFGLTRILAIAFSAFAGLAIIAAGAWQLESGRTDRARGHRELSRFLWIAIGGGVLILAGYVMWVVSVTPADLRADRFIARANGGPWAVIGGWAKHRGDYQSFFLYNVDNGRAVRIPSMERWWFSGVLLSRVNLALWTVPSAGAEELWLARLGGAKVTPVRTKITLKQPSFFDFSNDGTRLALMELSGALTVYDVASGTSLGSARIPTGDYWAGYFASPTLVRVYAYSQGHPTAIYEYDVVRRLVTVTGQLTRNVFRFRINRDHTLAAALIRSGFEICDARTGALLHSVPGDFMTVRFLNDGRIAAIVRRGGLRVFSADGAELQEIALPPEAESIIDLGGGRVVVGLWPWSAAVVDIDRGTMRVEPGLWPAPFANAGGRLFCRSASGIVLWNPVTNEKRLISRS